MWLIEVGPFPPPRDFILLIRYRADLKVENILLDGPGPFPKVLLADFGQARLSDVSFNSLTGELCSEID